MRIPRNGNRAINQRPDKRPYEPGHRLRPSAQNLQTQAHAVHIGTIIRDDAEREDDEAELAEAAERGKEDRCEEAADVAALIEPGVIIRWLEGHGVVGHCCCDGQAKHLREEEGEDETGPCPGESLDAGDGVGLVDGIIGRVARPASREAEYAGCET